jgi:uncharacterized protein YciI
MKHYLCRFRPPRVDFTKTMTAEEAALFSAHGQYLQTLLKDGKVIAHGPVADPAGGWGLSLFEIDDGDDLESLLAQDPMISARIGASYESFTMVHLRYRK